MGPRALTASSGLAPWSMAGIVLRQRKRKIQLLLGVKGACPLGLPPPLGERGGHPRNFHASLKKREKGFPMKTNTMPAATGKQNGNTKGISILN